MTDNQHDDEFDDDYDDDDHEEYIDPPYHIVVGATWCYNCGNAHKVAVILGTFDRHMRCFARYVTELPDALLQAMREHTVYEKRFSRMAKMEYYANCCPHCGALSGDHFLHDGGAVFGPLDPEAAAALKVFSVGVRVEGRVKGTFAWSSAIDWILQAARKP